MRRILVALLLALAGGIGMGTAAQPALAAGLCVGTAPGCYATLQAALAAAQDGDVIHIGPGTFAGGVTIDKSVSLVGAGPKLTIISGGGSVLTIGTIFAPSEPTVSIEGVTITGGVARSSPESTAFVRQAGVMAMGGGIEIPPNADFSGGASVSISNSVITGNRVAPMTAIDSRLPCPSDITITCINGDLPFAWAVGGGIDNWGTLTITNTTISNNLVGAAAGFPSVASDTYAGAIQNWLAPLTLSNTTITGNRISATAPNARFADSGAIFLEGGALTMTNSTITDNEASLDASMPTDVVSGTLAVAGGVHVGGGVSTASIRNTTISHNAVSMTNTVGDSTAFSGGLHTDGTFALSNDVIADNSVVSSTLPGSTGDAQADSGAGEMAGTIDNTRLTGNSVTVSSVAGSANVSAGAAILTGTMTNSVVSANSLHATSPNGSIRVAGGGLEVVGGPLTLRNTVVSGNKGAAQGLTGAAQGGGIAADGGPLNLIESSVIHNALSGSAGIALQGGGLYLTNPLTLTHSIISGNVPDNCFGSSC